MEPKLDSYNVRFEIKFPNGEVGYGSLPVQGEDFAAAEKEAKLFLNHARITGIQRDSFYDENF